MLLIALVLAVLLVTLIIKREKDTYIEITEVALDFYAKLFSKQAVEQCKEDTVHAFKTIGKALKQIGRALYLLGGWFVALPVITLLLPLISLIVPVVSTFTRKD